jgi:hypothetical protein
MEDDAEEVPNPEAVRSLPDARAVRAVDSSPSRYVLRAASLAAVAAA